MLCCFAEPARHAKAPPAEISTEGLVGDYAPASESARGELQPFVYQMQKGVFVSAVLQDGSALVCEIKLDPSHDFMTIQSEDKSRKVMLRDIRDVLSEPGQLKRVETKATIIDDPSCLALHIDKSGSCIVFRCNSATERKDLVTALLWLKRKALAKDVPASV